MLGPCGRHAFSRRGASWKHLRSAAGFVLSFAILFLLAANAHAQNPIVVENQLPGAPSSQWDITGAGDLTIQGFGTDISVNRGETIHFKINTNASLYHIDIYRLGYYQGNGARLVGTGVITATLPQTQPAPLTFPTTGLTDCGNWSESAHWDVPANATSGIYIAKLTRNDTGGASHIAFVVRDDASHSDLLFQTSDGTWQAYNDYGGNSLYVGSSSGPPSLTRATKVSYNRPFYTRTAGNGVPPAENWLFNSEYPMVRFLESNGYDMSYTTEIDTNRRGNLILNHKVFLSVGHDEYWAGTARASVEAARDAGVHLAFFSGNEVYWKTRFEPSYDGTNTPNRTMVCYKEADGVKTDPLTGVWTGLWRDGCPPTYAPNDGCRPENALTGEISFAINDDAINVTDAYKDLRIWRNTDVAALGPGQSVTMTPATLGFEWDWEQSDWASSYPQRRIILSTTNSNSEIHHISLYRALSGALVFGAGTVQWAWGLDSNHDRANDPPSPAMRQATVNVLGEMDAQPATIQAGLVAATPDHVAPTSVITFPQSGASPPSGTRITITGTASDAGGGSVYGVEVSVDGGNTWNPATGTTSWSYSWMPGATGPLTIKSRAYDDVGNLEIPGPGSSITVAYPTFPSGPQTVFDPSSVPGVPSEQDPSALELGMRFRSAYDGYVTSVRFYKGSQNVGTHTGHLWTNDGTLMGSVTFTNETASGWQQANFASPISIGAGTTYVISYHTDGYYSDDQNFFVNSIYNGALRATADGEDGPNGVYIYGATSFPTASFSSVNYWVDVVFTPPLPDTTPPVISAIVAAPADDGQNATITWTTDEGSTSHVDYGTSSGALTSSVNDNSIVRSHSMPLTGLTPMTTYYYRVTSVDAFANSGTSPNPPAAPLSFLEPAPLCFRDQTVADFSAGTTTNTYVSNTTDGEVILAPALGAEFAGSVLPAGWQSAAWATGGTTVVGLGSLTLNGAHAATTATYGPNRSIEFVATFGAATNQQIGFTTDFPITSTQPVAVFSTRSSTTTLSARVMGSTATNTVIPGSWLGAPHRYRIDWNATNFVFYIDGAAVTTITKTISTSMLAQASDQTVGGPALSVDWLRVTPYASSGSYVSSVHDGGAAKHWMTASWSPTTPSGTTVAVSVRAGNTPTPDGTWSAYKPIGSPGAVVDLCGRYVQYKGDLTTSVAGSTPTLDVVSLTCLPASAITPAVATLAAAPGTGNDTSGELKLRLTWSDGPSSGMAKVYRKGFGDYPLFRSNVGAVPATPATPAAAQAAGWTLTSITSSGQLDQPATRDYWYYALFYVDECGNSSAPSNVASISGYLLGDVSNAVSTCQGNNVVNAADISLLGAHYGATLSGPGDPLTCLDVGPTSDSSTSGRPQPDGVVEFEDLLMFALNYTGASGPASARPVAPHPAATNAVALAVPPLPAVGETFEVAIQGKGAGNLQGMTVSFSFDQNVVQQIGVSQGELLARQAVPAAVFSPHVGRVDLALLGTGAPLSGEGELARVRFRVRAAGDPAITLGAIDARDGANHKQTMGPPEASGPTVTRARTELLAAFPNPFSSSLTVALSLAEEQHVKLAVFDAAGRRVSTLLDGTERAGQRMVPWDGRDNSGAALRPGYYVVRFQAGQVVQNRRVWLIR
jgi:hypothetical protein